MTLVVVCLTFYLNFVRHSVTAIVMVRYAIMVKNTIKPNHKLNSVLKYTTAMTMSMSVGKMLKKTENKNQVRKMYY